MNTRARIERPTPDAAPFTKGGGWERYDALLPTSISGVLAGLNTTEQSERHIPLRFRVRIDSASGGSDSLVALCATGRSLPFVLPFSLWPTEPGTFAVSLHQVGESDTELVSIECDLHSASTPTSSAGGPSGQYL